MKKIVLVCVALVIPFLDGFARRLTDQEICEFGGCYFVPVTSGPLWRMRDRHGKIREFEPFGRSQQLLKSVDNWTAEFLTNNTVKVTNPSRFGKQIHWFSNGRLASVDVDGRHCNFKYDEPLIYDDDHIVPLWPESDLIGKEEFQDRTKMWKGGGRFRAWFTSPNSAGAFFMALALLCFGLCFHGKGALFKTACLLPSIAFTALMVMTASRGALVGFVAGAISAAVCKIYTAGRFSRRMLLVILAGLSVVGIFWGFLGQTRRSTGGDRDSNAQRIEVWSAATAMMADAPFGFESRQRTGEAYSEWYQPQRDGRKRLNLISDHLTTIVKSGWIGGAAYIAFWLGMIVLLAEFALSGGSVIPLAVWIAVGAAASFNVVLWAEGLFLLPPACCIPLIFDRRWLRRRYIVTAALSGVLIAFTIVSTLVIFGKILASRELPLKFNHGGRVVRVNGAPANIWVVDDNDVLGFVSTTREIRTFYRACPEADPIGYVRNVQDLPARGIQRLVLSGGSAADYLRYRRGTHTKADLPFEIILLSPKISAEAFKKSLGAEVRVHTVIGEFGARYFEEYAKHSRDVTIVPGAEFYIPGWMQYCFIDCNGGSK